MGNITSCTYPLHQHEIHDVSCKVLSTRLKSDGPPVGAEEYIPDTEVAENTTHRYKFKRLNTQIRYEWCSCAINNNHRSINLNFINDDDVNININNNDWFWMGLFAFAAVSVIALVRSKSQ